MAPRRRRYACCAGDRCCERPLHPAERGVPVGWGRRHSRSGRRWRLPGVIERSSGGLRPRAVRRSPGHVHPGWLMTSKLRFGVVNESVLGGSAWLDHVRRVEDVGIDVFLVRDHFSAGAYGQQLAPFSALAAAAAVTARLNVGTLVLANDFRHPVIVAHEAASLHHLSGGRFELGLGAGWYQPEYEAAGIPFEPPRQRIDRLEEALAVIGGPRDGDPGDHPRAPYHGTRPGPYVLPPPPGPPPPPLRA